MLLKQGPEVDSIIVRRIWKTIVITEGDNHYMVEQGTGKPVAIPQFSSSLDEAYKIVDYMQSKGWTFRIQNIPEKNVFYATFYKEDGNTYPMYEAATIPLAICYAAISTSNNYNI